MQNTIFPLPKIHRFAVVAGILFGMVGEEAAIAQTFINGDFESGSTGWSGCPMETGPASIYGGTGSNIVAEVDGDLTTDPTDDRSLCQTISGFTIGGVYRLEFAAARRGTSGTPDPVSVTMSLDGDALYRTVSRSGGYSMVSEGYEFVASRATHEFRVEPDFEGSYGMLFDDFSITYLYLLPVELIYFTGVATNSGVQLNWSTASEQGNSHFTVQRSLDGRSFEDLIEVQGAGYSAAPINYVALDLSPLSSMAYYRLAQTDFDGTVTHSSMIPVVVDQAFTSVLAIYPNPSTGGPLWLFPDANAEAADAVLSVQDASGRLVHQSVMSVVPGVPLDLSEEVVLESGSYVVTMPIAGVVKGARIIVE